jgi:hypothetical protein
MPPPDPPTACTVAQLATAHHAGKWFGGRHPRKAKLWVTLDTTSQLLGNHQCAAYPRHSCRQPTPDEWRARLRQFGFR